MLRRRPLFIGNLVIAKTLLGWLLILCVTVPFPAAAADTHRVEIQNAPKALEAKLKLVSDLAKGVRNYPTNASLRRAARRDVEAVNKALKSAGYYSGQASFDILQDGSHEKPTVVFDIDAGPLFQITEYEILYEDEGADQPPSFDAVGLAPGGASDGAALKARQEDYQNALQESGYPSAEIISRRVIANFETGQAHAVFVFRSGPKAKFGAPVITGVKKTDPSFITRMVTWEEGEEYDRKKLTSYYDRLRETNLYSTIDISPGAPDEAGVTPIIVRLEERKQRTIGVGVSYATDEGPGGRLFFEHRNVFGHGENSRIELRGSRFEQSAKASITRPMPRLGAQAFATGAFENETTDAFDARSLKLSSGLSKHWLHENLETRAAIALETSKIRDNGVEDRNYFISTPLSVIWNSENDLLNPTRGVRASWTITPYTGSESFTQTELSARTRIHFGSDERFTLAARAGLGATFANSINGMPLNKRFYAGGGGSVRGYGFQEAGPLDAENTPVGGLSRVEGAIEARVKASKNIQFAGFVDAGSVSASSVPDFKDDFFIGYGGGVRYFTPIGPIRIDVAFPTNKRPTDADFQVYIALGQSF